MNESDKPVCKVIPVDDIKNARGAIVTSRTLILERLEQITTDTPSYAELATWKSLKDDLERAEMLISRLINILK